MTLQCNLKPNSFIINRNKKRENKKKISKIKGKIPTQTLIFSILNFIDPMPRLFRMPNNTSRLEDVISECLPTSKT
jgi:hypothetical protein